MPMSETKPGEGEARGPWDPKAPGEDEAAAGKGDARHFGCPSCGGQLEWDPSHAQMKCPYCDSLVDVPSAQDFVAEEHDLLAFLESHPRAQGYGVTLTQLTCRQCGASVQHPAGRRDLTCPFCGSSYVLEDEKPPAEVLKPESLLPFTVGKQDTESRFASWLGRGWFRPNDLKRLGRLDRIAGLYLPFFTFDALARSAWTAMAGFYYTVQERVSVVEGGRTVWRQKSVRKVRWEPASGSRSDVYDDVLVPAIVDERLNLILKVYPFDLKRLVPYDSRYLTGFGILNPDLALKAVYGIARNNMVADQRSRCSKDVPGDTQRDLRVKTDLSEQTFKHVLCPLWIGSFRYKGKVYPFVVNGQTGSLYGEKPWSAWKIASALGVAALVVLLLWWLFGRGG